MALAPPFGLLGFQPFMEFIGPTAPLPTKFEGGKGGILEKLLKSSVAYIEAFTDTSFFQKYTIHEYFYLFYPKFSVYYHLYLSESTPQTLL